MSIVIPLRVLILEDQQDDAELMAHALRQAGIMPDWRRVDTEEDFVRNLEPPPELILSDHSLPQFSSVRALARLRERGMEVPFIIVSGTISQELAIGLLEQGVDDFVLKDRLGPLGSAVLRALERKQLREEKRLGVQKLLASERRFRALIEHSADGIVLLSRQAEVLYSSPTVVRILGYAPEEIVGRNAFDLVHPEDVASAHAQLERMLDSPGGVVSATRHVLHNDGSWHWLEWVGTNLLAEPDVQAIVINYRDITERKRAEEALGTAHEELACQAEEMARSNRELEQFAYVASHDLQEPLRMIASYLELLAERYKGRLDEKADKFIDYAVDGATRMKRLISDLLHYSRITTMSRALEMIDVASAFDEVTTNLGRAIAEKRAIVTQDGLPTMVVDRTHLVQLFQNLIGNALKFCEGTPRIHVEAKHEGRNWVFLVSDNGIGIAPEHSERIFQIFQRLHGREKYVGTGIGLAICKKIVEQYGGRIWVESRPGKGSTFFFTLPVVG